MKNSTPSLANLPKRLKPLARQLVKAKWDKQARSNSPANPKKK